MSKSLPLVVYCHLRWDFVYQRPQHVVSRLAATRKVLFVEEPVRDGCSLRLDTSDVAANVVRCVPRGGTGHNGFDERARDDFTGLLSASLARAQAEGHVAWLYTPMAVPLARALEPRAVVYDCMDELSAFHGAPPALIAREDELFGWTNVVFTGGPSLYRAKSSRHPNVHCFPSSVDVGHFGRATQAEAQPVEQAAIPQPRLGFYGVLDERLDRELLDAVAAAHPEWQLVLVGPVVKIAEADLPRRPNIHYFGQRAYESLPGFLAGWDVCLLPFALNDATRFISPTKVLEYMAAERPIVSTPIADVAEPYGEVVRIAASPAEFVAACEAALAEPQSVAAMRMTRMREILSHTSWDSTVDRMAEIVDSLTKTSKGHDLWQKKTLSSSAPARQG